LQRPQSSLNDNYKFNLRLQIFLFPQIIAFGKDPQQKEKYSLFSPKNKQKYSARFFARVRNVRKMAILKGVNIN
jgi:hypothetical protein